MSLKRTGHPRRAKDAQITISGELPLFGETIARVSVVSMKQEKPYVAPFIRRLMPMASEEEILEASENLRAYLKLLYGIYMRRETEQVDSSDSHLRDRFQCNGGLPPTI